MKIFEMVQSAYNGGSPLANGNGVFEHGENVFIVEHDGFLELAYEFLLCCQARHPLRPVIQQVLRAKRGFMRLDGSYVDFKSDEARDILGIPRR